MTFKKLIFVSGKGGVGKSTISLLLSRYLSLQGRNVLYVELSKQSSAQPLLEKENPPDSAPSDSGFGFDWCRLEALSCLVEYVGSVTRTRALSRTFFQSPIISSLLDVAPGLNDLAILGKLTSQARGHGPGFNYDHVVVDAPSTGSFSSLLAAPEVLGASVSSGPMHTQSKGIAKVLRDKNEVQFLLVSLFEELPVDELEETLKEFSRQFPDQASVIMNKWMEIKTSSEGGPNWRDFIEPRLQQQLSLGQRVAELGAEVSLVNLMVRPLKLEMQELSGEFLRHT